ncbi:uncharacterized protein V1516DRAFT_675238 [Lipomyces oligophaga]|uniref:uncharacterized protein n=1 Tax=Lipomyces oligophaga TaxID=45792 RepID=UPI0034CF33ED
MFDFIRPVPANTISDLQTLRSSSEFSSFLFKAILPAKLDLKKNNSEWETNTRKLVNEVTLALRPLSEKWISLEDEYAETRTRWNLQRTFVSVAEILLKQLHIMLEFIDYSSADLDLKLLIETVATYDSSLYAWSNNVCSELSNKIANDLQISAERKLVVCHEILAISLRPAFQSIKRRNVSNAGRISLERDHELGHAFTTEEPRSWSDLRPEAASILLYIVKHCHNMDFFRNNWALIVPSTLVIIDDPDPTYKTQGSLILEQILLECNPNFISNTGLVPVFWESLMNCLTYLPYGIGAISVKESRELLKVSYRVLIQLASISSIEPAQSKSVLFSDSRVVLNESTYARRLGQIVTDGIFHGMSVGSDEVEISNLLIGELQTVCKLMKFRFAVYLQESVKILVNILSNPFATLYTPLLITTLDTFDTIIVETAARIHIYRYYILKGILFCWRQSLDGENIEDISFLQAKLKSTAKALEKCCEGEVNDVDWHATVQRIIQSDVRFEEIFV